MAGPLTAAPAGGSEPSWCGTRPGGSAEALARHAHAAQAARRAGPVPTDRLAEGLAILEDRGDLIAPANPFDLEGAALRFVPTADEGYEVVRTGRVLDPPGDPVAVGDGRARAVELPFAFPFFGVRHGRVFLHADGHLTLERPDPEGGDHGLARFLGGPPRIAALFAPLEPWRGGEVTAEIGAHRAVFQWRGVPGAGQVNRNTFAIALLPDGEVELIYGRVESRRSIAGLAPGGGSAFTRLDLGQGGRAPARTAPVERFGETDEADLVSIVRRLLGAHGDGFDQVVVYTARTLNPLPGTLAFQVNVRNAVRGIGLEVLDEGASWGSRERLASVVYMDAVDLYLEADGLEILSHEVGHRFLARLRLRGAGGEDGALLGSGGVHWSFFLDSDASVMEGNDIAERGGGRFETVDFARRFSPLDQYAMGLRAPEEVPPFFYVSGADDFRPPRPYRSSSPPEAGVRFTGTRREVHISDVIAALGPRVPQADRAPRVLRQAWVLVADALAPASRARVEALARVRRRLEAFYRQATDGRGLLETSLP